MVLANFCVETACKSDWVQSQELSVVLLGRLVRRFLFGGFFVRFWSVRLIVLVAFVWWRRGS